MSETYTYLAGYARVDITPVESAPLAGFGATSLRMSQSVRDPLYATCIAVTAEDGSSVLFYTTDLITCLPEQVAQVRQAVSEAIGVPQDHIMITATHTHSGPCQLNHQEAYMDKYRADYVPWLTEAGIKAWEDRKPATLQGCKTETKGLNFVRHYICEDGTFQGPGFGDPQKTKIGHVSEPDPEMLLLRFTREGGRDILIMNWQAHATRTGGPKKFEVSADFVGAVRAYLEEKTDCLFAFYQGAAGDLMPNSTIKEENPTTDLEEYAGMLGDTALKALPALRELPGGPIRVRKGTMRCKVNHEEDHKLPEALEVIKLWKETYDRTLCREFAASKGFYAVFHATNLPKRVEMPEYLEHEADAFVIGETAFVTGPCEIFSATGQAIKRESPYEMTLVLSCANDRGGYFPTRRAFEIGTYEAGCCRFAPGIDDTLKDHLIGLLKELKEEA